MGPKVSKPDHPEPKPYRPKHKENEEKKEVGEILEHKQLHKDGYKEGHKEVHKEEHVNMNIPADHYEKKRHQSHPNPTENALHVEKGEKVEKVEKGDVEKLGKNENIDLNINLNIDEHLQNLNLSDEKTRSSNSVGKKMKINLKTTGGSLNKDIREIYKFKEVLGGGHFGTVRVGYRRLSESKRLYAVKSISKKNLTAKDLEDLMKEVEILSNLEHPNIIHFYETYYDQYYFHIVMELCRGKEVFDRIIEEGNLNELKVCNIIYKVLNAISYCHAAGITHRDLKPENILFETTEPDAEIKLIDFGLSRKYDINEKMHTILGTPYYVSPEVLKGNYDHKCDIWSIGALAYIMLSGEPPFNGNTNNEIFNKIMTEELNFNKEKWRKVSKDAKDFIKHCMIKKPELRFDTAKAIEHQWFKNLHKEIHSSGNLNLEILENLKNFSTPQKLKRMVLKFLVNLLSQNDIKKLRQAFFAIDLDHTGYINKDELGKAFTLAGIEISEDELNKILESADDQENEKLDYSEFLVASLNQKKFIDKEKLVNAFKYFDIDNSGSIDSSDLKNAMLRSGKQIINSDEVDKILEEVGDDQQKLSLEKFLKLFGYDL